MNKSTVLMRASFLQLRPYLWSILGTIAISILANVIVSLSLGDNGENTQVSAANLLTVFLLFIGSVLPAGLFRRVMNLGATRKEYYAGMLLVYALWSAIFAMLNIIWLQIEIGFIRNYENTFNILEIFGWSQFGIVGMFVYQFGAYLLLISLLNLLFSGLRHVLGWVVWVVFIAAIPIFTSIPSLRHTLADGLQALLFNDSLLQGFGLTLLISLVLLAGGWWFTARRTIS
ncbi:hypothetical protein PVOR_03075 [Paenibacillus vortex V453]|uniref:Uncharacterized protein n=2 Tax=Paenibacillus TaxID=44249 RepID=A0A163J555_9BACL|nr:MULTISPECIES: hypothetical protein [Paenibacillus]AWP30158.1 hypothetical protein B9D94_27645 [Paenibacillus sp. Cedars]EFU43316.1 hypothetical protein PVOR_03075 [Paenibacillus vortex V453]KZS46369.1 hypothetical protein AWU65_10805 [Paenibacillus glucanolyticus]MDH6671134.1 hypothetical protein [Paenibacillus sp. LBL]MPY15909.1 hypothetical protein [Paenibacillus glucanolyticus]